MQPNRLTTVLASGGIIIITTLIMHGMCNVLLLLTRAAAHCIGPEMNLHLDPASPLFLTTLVMVTAATRQQPPQSALRLCQPPPAVTPSPCPTLNPGHNGFHRQFNLTNEVIGLERVFIPHLPAYIQQHMLQEMNHCTYICCHSCPCINHCTYHVNALEQVPLACLCNKMQNFAIS